MASQEQKSLAIVRLKEVKARTGRCRSSIYADVRAGKFPAPINIGSRAVGWIDSEIDSWIADRVADSRRGLK